MDPDNPVVKLCGEGIQVELEGRHAEARSIYLEAWELRTDAYEACIAAHYVARHQDTPEETLRWNQLALEQADAVADGRVTSFYPSLLLNVGHSHEVLGDPETARRYYRLAADRLGDVPEGPYRDEVQQGVTNGLGRVGAGGS